MTTAWRCAPCQRMRPIQITQWSGSWACNLLAKIKIRCGWLRWREWDCVGAADHVAAARAHTSQAVSASCHCNQTFCPPSGSDTHLQIWRAPRSAATRVGVIVLISESSSNEHMKQDYCESRVNFLTKYSKPWITTHLEAQNGPKVWASGAYLLYTYKNSSNELIKSSFKWIQQKLFKIIDEKLYIDLFWLYLDPKRARKFGPQAPFFTHTPGSTHNMPVTKFHGPVLKPFWENGHKPKKIQLFTYFFL